MLKYLFSYPDKVWSLTLEHLTITAVAVLLAIIIGVPVGMYISRSEKAAAVVLYLTGIIQTIPSIAIFGLLIPLLGIGFKPAVVALVLYGQLSIIRNTYVGITNVPRDLIEAGLGMGMTKWEILRLIELPVAFSVIIGGIRTATVTIIGIATIAEFIGAGGLGYFIVRGVSSLNFSMVFVGAVVAALLSILADFLLGKVEQAFDPMQKKSKVPVHVAQKQPVSMPEEG